MIWLTSLAEKNIFCDPIRISVSSPREYFFVAPEILPFYSTQMYSILTCEQSLPIPLSEPQRVHRIAGQKSPGERHHDPQTRTELHPH